MNPYENLLLKFQSSEFGYPDGSGVYLVCARAHNCCFTSMTERILYIGSSKNIHKRLSGRSHPCRQMFDRLKNCLVYVKFFECDNYLDIEKELIKEIKPILNSQLRGYNDY